MTGGKPQEEAELIVKSQSIQIYFKGLKAVHRKADLGEILMLRDSYSYEDFTSFILEFLEPWLDDLRADGRLTVGKAQLKIGGRNVDYEGELWEGQAFGKGKYSRDNLSVEGTFLNDKATGIVVQKYFGETMEGEMKDDRFFGKNTQYREYFEIGNRMEDSEGIVYELDVTDEPEFAWYKDGRPLKAHVADWKEYRGQKNLFN